MKCASARHRDPSPALYVKPRLIRHFFLLPMVLLAMLGLGYAGFVISQHNGMRALAESAERQLELHARAVESEINKFNYLPSLLELEDSVAALLDDPDGGPRQAVNEYLEGLNRRSHSRAIYVLDTSGRVQASSNWRDKDSYLGEDLAFRAYFQDAVRGRPGRFYGIGSTSGEPGYYVAHGLEEHGRIIGVAVIKVRLEAIEERWQKARCKPSSATRTASSFSPATRRGGSSRLPRSVHRPRSAWRAACNTTGGRSTSCSHWRVNRSATASRRLPLPAIASSPVVCPRSAICCRAAPCSTAPGISPCSRHWWSYGASR